MDKSKGGADQVVIEMTVKQALRVAARESKAVRRSLVDKLEDMQAIQSRPKAPQGLLNTGLPKLNNLKLRRWRKHRIGPRADVNVPAAW